MDDFVEDCTVSASGDFCKFLYLEDASNTLERDELEKLLEIRSYELFQEENETSLRFVRFDQVRNNKVFLLNVVQIVKQNDHTP